MDETQPMMEDTMVEKTQHMMEEPRCLAGVEATKQLVEFWTTVYAHIKDSKVCEHNKELHDLLESYLSPDSMVKKKSIIRLIKKNPEAALWLKQHLHLYHFEQKTHISIDTFIATLDKNLASVQRKDTNLKNFIESLIKLLSEVKNILAKCETRSKGKVMADTAVVALVVAALVTSVCFFSGAAIPIALQAYDVRTSKMAATALKAIGRGASDQEDYKKILSRGASLTPGLAALASNLRTESLRNNSFTRSVGGATRFVRNKFQKRPHSTSAKKTYDHPIINIVSP